MIIARYNPDKELWEAKSDKNPDFLAVTSGWLGLGSHQWTVYNDSRKCSSESSYKITLTLTSCRKDEFTCADANCIPMENRLDVDSIAVSIQLQH